MVGCCGSILGCSPLRMPRPHCRMPASYDAAAALQHAPQHPAARRGMIGCWHPKMPPGILDAPQHLEPPQRAARHSGALFWPPTAPERQRCSPGPHPRRGRLTGTCAAGRWLCGGGSPSGLGPRGGRRVAAARAGGAEAPLGRPPRHGRRRWWRRSRGPARCHHIRIVLKTKTSP